jgi:hypothetical protein
MIEFQAGEVKELNIRLTPVVVEVALSIYDLLLTSNYRQPNAADNYIHARIKNNGAIAQTREITAYYWESWMTLDQAQHRTQAITINPGQTIEYLEHFHGNDYTEYDMAVWLAGDWTEQPLTRQLNFQGGYHLPRTILAEAHVVEAGADYAIIRYAQYGTCNKWEYDLNTPPTPPFVQRLDGLWRTASAYCAYWLIPGLIPVSLYEAHCSGGITANREDWVQFSTH